VTRVASRTTRQGRTPWLVSGPLRSFASKLEGYTIGIRRFGCLEQLTYATHITSLCLLDGLLGQIISQHKAWIKGVHTGLSALYALHSVEIALQPRPPCLLKRGAWGIIKCVLNRVEGIFSCCDLGQAPKTHGHVCGLSLHQFSEVRPQKLISLTTVGIEAEFAYHHRT